MSFLRSGQEHVGGVVVVFWVSLDFWEVDDSVVVSSLLGKLLELLGRVILFFWVVLILTERGDSTVSLGSFIITPSDGYNSLIS